MKSEPTWALLLLYFKIGRIIMANQFVEFKPIEPVSIVQEHRTDICGLTKHEYIALELTKAMANTRHASYWDSDTTVDKYEIILKEVKERNL